MEKLKRLEFKLEEWISKSKIHKIIANIIVVIISLNVGYYVGMFIAKILIISGLYDFFAEIFRFIII